MCLQQGWAMVVPCSGKQDILVDEQNGPPTASWGSPLNTPVGSLCVGAICPYAPVPETKPNFREVFWKFLGFNLASIWKKANF
jgi:hypothetical protein